jgi:hypothetical protein
MRDPQHKRQSGEPLEPSTFLDLAISDVNVPLFSQELMKDAGGDGATMKIAKRKLNVIFAIQSHSGLANNEKQVNKLKNKHTLAASLARINQLDREEVATKDEDEVKRRHQTHEGAIAKLASERRDASMITKLEIASMNG